jgi:hypothetical protein
MKNFRGPIEAMQDGMEVVKFEFKNRPTPRGHLGLSRLEVVVLRLLARSMWFAVMPLPNDQWEITVKSERAARVSLESVLKEVE